MTLSEVAQRVIGLAREVSEYYAAELPKWHPDYPLIHGNEEGPPPPPAEAELRALLGSLPAETVNRLMLIMYLGRGDFGIDDLAGAYQDLKATSERPENAASYMMAKASLADYLADGLEELHRHGIDVDRLPLRRAGARKR